jgi:hypothetical protein
MAKERISLTLSPEIWVRTKRVAAQRGTSASALVAEALEALLAQAQSEVRLEAARAIAQMDLPVASPEQLERETIDGMLRGTAEGVGL